MNATFRHSTLWNDDLTVFFLSKNMQLDCSDTSAESFAKWLLDVGNGNNLLPDNKVQLLDGMQVPDLNSLINSTYPGIDSDEPPSQYFPHPHGFQWNAVDSIKIQWNPLD